MTQKEQNGLPRSILHITLCKLQEVYYAIGCDKDFEMHLADSKFESPRMKKEAITSNGCSCTK